MIYDSFAAHLVAFSLISSFLSTVMTLCISFENTSAKSYSYFVSFFQQRQQETVFFALY